MRIHRPAPLAALSLLAAIGCTGDLSSPVGSPGSAELPVRSAAGGVDQFDVRAIYPTAPGGRTWHARWDGPARTFGSGQVDPYDPEFHNRGRDTTFTVHGDGTATASGGVMRHYIWDRSRRDTWGDIELTFYAMRVSERPDAPSRAGFTVEVRTDDGHTSDPSRQCRGHAYAATFRYWGGAKLGKELKHPIYADEGGPEGRNIWGGGELPKDRWIGFKLVARDVPEGVRLELYRDMTDGRDGGDWELVLSHTDDGGWGSSEHESLCGHPSDRVLRGAYPLVLLRNDGSTMRYKHASVREIRAADDAAFLDIGDTPFRGDIEWLADRGVARGCNPPWNTWYCPDRPVTRGQMAALLRRALGLPAGSGDTFVDDDDSVFEADIEAIAAAGITRGCNPPANDRFCPDETVTRGQMAALLSRAFELPRSGGDTFVDDDGSVFEADIEAIAAAGITRGCNPPENDRFCPDERVTRGQMAAFLRRALASGSGPADGADGSGDAGDPSGGSDDGGSDDGGSDDGGSDDGGSGDTAGEPDTTFTDIDGSPHAGAIEWLADRGIASGCNPPDNDRFCPADDVTRAQAASLLARALELPPGPDVFVDDDGSVHEDDIEAIAAAGITHGCNPPANDRFCPADVVTRAQMAAFLGRGFDLPPGPDAFVDDDGHVLESEIDALAAAGITRGCNPPANDRFCPDQRVTRAQLATFLYRALTP